MTLFSLARRAYAYGLPIVAVHRLLHESALDRWSPGFRAPLNEFAAGAGLPPPAAASLLPGREAGATAWLDLRAGPVVIGVPGARGDAQLSVTVMDLAARIVGQCRARPTSDGGASVVVVGPSGVADPAAGLPVLGCPTQLCLAMVCPSGRQERGDLAGTAGRPTVRSWLSRSGARAGSPAPPAVLPIAWVDVRAAPCLNFLRVLDWMLRLMPLDPEDRLRRELLAVGFGGPGLEALLEDYRSGEELLAGLRMGMHDLLRAAHGGPTGRAAGADAGLAGALRVYRCLSPAPPPRLTVVGSDGMGVQRHPSRVATVPIPAADRPDEAGARSAAVRPTVA